MVEAVGVVGLGAMGLPMARTLSAAGFAVRGFDASAERRALLPEAVTVLEEVAGADVVLLSLPNDAAVRAVAHTLLPRLSPGRVVVDTSTVSPETARAMQAAAAGRGVGWVDAPVSGGAAGAASGALLVMAGGEDGDVARAMPVLSALARHVARCGGPGAGATVKLANNMLCAGQLLLAGEALRLAQANGVAAEAMLDAVNAGSGRSAVTEVNLPRWVLSGAFDSAFSVGLMAKDVTLAEDLPGAGALAAEVAARWRAAAERLGDGADFNRIVETPPE
jgi:3-hydroxyisobutyrate dehydrogenase